MKKSNRIRPLKQLASRHEQQAARVLGESRTTLSDEQRRLNELCTYRDEYRTRFTTAGANGMDGNQVQAYQGFLRQLDHAIQQQRTQVAEAEKNCVSHTQSWHETHLKTQALDKTIQRFHSEETRQTDKREQREADDIAGRRLLPET
ncbi:MAG: flagellar export protein FliJ [Gammaproteobacteria bacterium]|nr:flagellar export protein FliJ [Gammaproteobacteria bacterium]